MNDVVGNVRYGTRVSFKDAFGNIATKTFWNKNHAQSAIEYITAQAVSKIVHPTLFGDKAQMYVPFHFFESVSEKA